MKKTTFLTIALIFGLIVSLKAQSVIYDNGPYYNISGTPNYSLLEAPNTTLGVGHAASTGYRVADEWVLTETVEVNSIDFFAYQTGSTTTSTMTAVTLRVWDGDPSDPASTVVYGDASTNLMTATSFTGAYRVSEASPTATNRPIMRNTVSTPGLVLTPGTYWLDWDAAGTLTSGPWAPPISISSQLATGNAKQYDPTATPPAWGNLLDGGSTQPQGLPFEVTGSVLGIADNVIEGFSYFPNPVRDVINVSAKENIENITVYNMLGQELIRQSPAAPNTQINIADLSNGVYIMKATVNGVTGAYSIMKK